MSIRHFFLRADFEVMDPQEEELFQRDVQHFRQNAAWNFSSFLCVWNPNFFMRLLFGGFQKECLRLGHLLALADERSLLSPSVMVPLLFPGLAVGDLPSGAYLLFEVNFFLRSTYTHVGRILLQQHGVDFRPFLTLQPDFMPFTFYIAFPEPTWVSILQRLTLRGYFQVLSGDVPWTLDDCGTALLNLNFSPRSALLFLLLNLFYHHQRGRDFAHGIAHFVVLGFQMRCNNFMRMMTSGRFWNRQYIDFLLKVGDLSISDPLELASMVTMTSPAGESLWNLCAQYHGQTSRGYIWVGHTLVRQEMWNESVRLHGPADSLLSPALLARFFGTPTSAHRRSRL